MLVTELDHLSDPRHGTEVGVSETCNDEVDEILC